MKREILNIDIELPSYSSSLQENNKFLDYINSLSRIVIFSPHLDDAVLSAGSLISYAAEREIEVEVISVFTEGSDLLSIATKKLLANAGFSDGNRYFQARRDEDLVALNELSPKSIKHLGYTDAAWRKRGSGDAIYPDYPQLAGNTKTDPEDLALRDELILKFKELVASKNTQVFAPLAIGRQIDHFMTRTVAAAAFPDTIFYADYPYSSQYNNESEFIKEKSLTGFEWEGNYKKKKQAILQYTTQRVSLFSKGPIHLPYETYYFKMKGKG